MNPLDRALRLLSTSPLIDGHNDLPDRLRSLAGGPVSDHDLERAALHVGLPRAHTDLPRLRAGHVGAQFWSVFVPADLPEPEAVVRTLEQIDLVHRMVRLHGDRLALVGTAAGVEAAYQAGRVAGLIGAEGGHSIGASLGVLRMFRQLGVRYLTLTHNRNTAWADSATDQPGCGGLSGFGREVVHEMNRIGMLVDLSHVAGSTMTAALAATRAPVLFSHSSARSVCDHPRNVPDEILTGLPRNNGLCMVTFVPAFVSADRYAWETAGRTGPPPPVTVAQVADHIDHVRDVAGVAHVGIGGDFDGCDDMPDGLDDVAAYPRLFAELAGRGWSDEELALLAGGNLLRVLRAADDCAV